MSLITQNVCLDILQGLRITMQPVHAYMVVRQLPFKMYT